MADADLTLRIFPDFSLVTDAIASEIMCFRSEMCGGNGGTNIASFT
jgi:hypothetical protein